jgi:surfactin synthase thioesterase subunit
MNNPKPTIIILPFAGGNASYFKCWQEVIGDKMKLEIIEYPGHGLRMKEPLCQNLDDLFDDIMIQLKNLSVSNPAIYGHSFGGLLVLELLRKKIITPEYVILSGINPPGTDGSTNVMVVPDNKNELFDYLESIGGLSECVLKDKRLFNLYFPVVKQDLLLAQELKENLCPFTINSHLLILNGIEDSLVNSVFIPIWRHTCGKQFLSMDYSGGHFFFEDDLDHYLEEIYIFVVNR